MINPKSIREEVPEDAAPNHETQDDLKSPQGIPENILIKTHQASTDALSQGIIDTSDAIAINKDPKYAEAFQQWLNTINNRSARTRLQVFGTQPLGTTFSKNDLVRTARALSDSLPVRAGAIPQDIAKLRLDKSSPFRIVKSRIKTPNEKNHRSASQVAFKLVFVEE